MVATGASPDLDHLSALLKVVAPLLLDLLADLSFTGYFFHRYPPAVRWLIIHPRFTVSVRVKILCSRERMSPSLFIKVSVKVPFVTRTAAFGREI